MKSKPAFPSVAIQPEPNPSDTLIHLDGVDVSLTGRRILANIHWQLRPGEHWVFLGANGSGKSTLLKLIRGDLWPDPAFVEKRHYLLNGAVQSSPIGVREKIAFVSPEQQERYWQSDWRLNGLDAICTGFSQTDLMYQRIQPGQKDRARQIACTLCIETLCPRGIHEMSAGELRKILIARALAGQPRILVLDEFCDGLDTRSRHHMLALLDTVAKSGTQLLYSTHRGNELVPATTHAAFLNAGTISISGPRAEVILFDPSREPQANAHRPTRAARSTKESQTHSHPAAASQFFLRIENVDVFLERRKILTDVSWQIKEGENWLVVGRNGAGKSTLLKLIGGELQPAWGGKVVRFGKTGATTIKNFRNKCGWVSADFQSCYREGLMGEQVIASGFFASVGLLDRIGRRRQARVHDLIHRLDLGALAGKSFLEMSYGERRKILLARAVVHNPRLVILDEPFDGLDVSTRADFTTALECLMRDGACLVLVTHHLEDAPRGISHVLALERGRILLQGKLRDVQVQRGIKKLFPGQKPALAS